MKWKLFAQVSVGAAALMLAGVVSAHAAPGDGDLDAVLADLNVTDEMVANSSFDLAEATANSSFDISPAGSEFTLETTETKGGQTVVTLTSDLLFEFGKSDLTEPARVALEDLAKEIPQGAALAVDGYTDSISGDDVNIPLSRERAQTVADALAAVRPDLSLTVTGHGSADPVADNTNSDGTDNPMGRALNRRVTLTYTTS